ncbi:DUF1616 domain-containing protein [Actinoplanes aureus]|uniref:DUF1616 domain-containing protein n=1 Tax=Actinoplanes aureus TaxID=2792083 RepID=A0A931FWD8_9ACTN|nr:DUF1616 domain-containing protein [Actinoplanes aureus]MBG0562333.1 DUF1616 domain-containing protein [Actinoplanes aureus]
MNAARAGALAGVTVASGAAVLAGPLAASVPGGLLLAFVLPGLAITEAMFRPGRLDIGVVERLVLIPALSLAVLVLGGLGLWAVGGSLNQAGWLSIAAAVALIATGVAVARPRIAPAAGAAESATRISTAAGATPRPGSKWRLSRRRLFRDVLPLTLALALISGIGWWSFTDSERTYDTAVVTLSATPPGAVDADGNRSVQVTATGLDAGRGPYRLVLSGTAGAELSEHRLTPDTAGEWSGRVSVPGTERVTMDLFRDGETAAFRTVIIAAAQ